MELARGRDEPLLLPTNPAPHLTDWLFDMGPTIAGGMGETAIGYRDMAAWQEISGIELLPWEAALLKRLSGEYASMRHKAEEQSCPAPYSGTADDLIAARERVAKQVDQAFSRLKGKRG